MQSSSMNRSSANDQIPPHDLDAERFVLGSMIIDADAADLVLERLTATDFYRTSHRCVFKAIKRLCDRAQPLDELVLREELDLHGELIAAGGLEGLRELSRDVFSSAFVGEHIRMISEKSKLRHLLAAATEVITLVHSHQPVAEIADRTEQMFLGALEDSGKNEVEALADLVPGVVQEIEGVMDGVEATGVKTRFREIDATLGGLHAGELIIIAARTSVGKTTLALNICYRIALSAEAAVPVLFFSLETTAKQIARNLLSMTAGVDLHRGGERYITPEQWEEVRSAAAKIDQGPIYIDDTGSLTTSQLKSAARRHIRKHGIGLIVVDYLQLVAGPKQENRQLEVSSISRSLKSLAMELEIPVLALAQLNREATHGRPRLSHLRESGSIEQDADKVVFLHRPMDPTADLDVVIAKNRNGPIGDSKLRFEPESLRFTEDTYAPRHVGSVPARNASTINNNGNGGPRPDADAEMVPIEQVAEAYTRESEQEI